MSPGKIPSCSSSTPNLSFFSFLFYFFRVRESPAGHLGPSAAQLLHGPRPSSPQLLTLASISPRSLISFPLRRHPHARMQREALAPVPLTSHRPDSSVFAVPGATGAPRPLYQVCRCATFMPSGAWSPAWPARSLHEGGATPAPHLPPLLFPLLF